MRLVPAASAALCVSLLALSPQAFARSDLSGSVAEDARSTAVEPIRAAVLADLTDRMSRARDERTRVWLTQLGTLYAHETARLFWFDESGWLPHTSPLQNELMRADEWGLDPKLIDVPVLHAEGIEGKARAEVGFTLAVLQYAWQAGGGRVEPTQLSKWLDHGPRAVDAERLVPAIAGDTDPARALSHLNPQHPQFLALREAYLAATGRRVSSDAPPPAIEPIPSGPRIVVGAYHPHVALVRQRLGVPAGGRDETGFDGELAAALAQRLREAGVKWRRRIDDDVRRVLNGGGTPRPKGPELAKIMVNMERWRWLPRDLGELHIWNNLPEFETRVVDKGRAVHRERIIIGKPETQTPVFSDRMETLVFKPDWGVPSSIKIKSLLPALQEGDYGVIERRGMRIVRNGKTVDPSRINWDKVDIRSVTIVQDPGSSNPLGEIKFLFPNRHDVYMHDTPSKGLFSSSSRMFSHGCIRVRNPRRLAEVIFERAERRPAGDVHALLGRKAKENNRIELGRQVPVHNVYFTLVADESGKLRSLPDIYRHDWRVSAALAGTPISRIAAADPALRLQRELEEIAPSKKRRYANR
ncbi:MAG: L,D-transpeptidase family protein [Pseudomonadota bacterium]